MLAFILYQLDYKESLKSLLRGLHKQGGKVNLQVYVVAFDNNDKKPNLLDFPPDTVSE